MVAALRNGKCGALIVNKVNIDLLRTKESNCDLRLAGKQLIPYSAGWVTNRQSPCVEAAFNYAFEVLKNRGTTNTEWKKVSTAVECPAVTGAPGSELTITDMSGLFIICASFMCLLVIIKVYANRTRATTTGLEETDPWQQELKKDDDVTKLTEMKVLESAFKKILANPAGVQVALSQQRAERVKSTGIELNLDDFTTTFEL